ncbi:PKD domain-containing protein [Paracnuella aquatica]|nr:PKD domain-containing protein [Paracnuella aquatica]
MKRTLCLLAAFLFIAFTGFSQSIKYTGNLCQGGSLVLTVDGAPAGATFQWLKDKIAVPTARAANHTIDKPGSYSVIVNSGDTLKAVDITEKANPTANFAFDPAGLCATVPIKFTNSSTGSNLTYSWNFDDVASSNNNSSTAANPSHRFRGNAGNSSQSFDVRLSVTNADGCTNSIVKKVAVKQTPSTELNGTGSTLYNGLPYFTQCSSTPSQFNFTNGSTTQSTNTNYEIQWGDGSTNYSSATFSSLLNHTYNVGVYKLLFIVTGQNGCKDTGTYNVFVGSNPAVGFGTRGNTVICSGSSLTFDISNTTNNPPGTNYTVTFNDETAPINFTHPVPLEVTHLFEIGSCGKVSGSFNNSFSASIQASNPCGTSAATVAPIYVSEKTKPAITISPKDTVCVNTQVTVTNSGTNGNSVSALGVCSAGKSVWKITPASGWTLTSGSLGDAFGSTDPSLWSAGSTSIGLSFQTAGVYTITLNSGGNSLCGSGTVVKTICVTPRPVAKFAVDKTSGCGPLAVKTTNSSDNPTCGNNNYRWSVSYANSAGCTPTTSNFNYVNGTSASSANPEFQFVNPGVYTVSLVVISPGGCESAPVTQAITVKEKPRISLNIPAAICQNGTITPTATVNNCYSSTAATYAWTFQNGTPATSNSATPGNVTFNISGPQLVTLAVTNECGTTTETQTVNVRTAPDVTVPPSQSICAGTATGVQNFTGTVSGTTFNWTNDNTSIGLAASGTGSIPSFTAVSNTTTPKVARITVTPVTGCVGPSATFTITVNPRPNAPTVTSPLTYCLNGAASALSATAAAGNTLTWYNNSTLTNGDPTSPIPATTTAGTTTYYVTQTGGGCASAPATISINVLPSISGNTIGPDQNLCSGNAATAITGVANLSGGNGSFTYQWQSSADGTTWVNISGATSATYNPGTPAASTKYRRLVTSGACTEQASNAVTINVQGALSNYEIGAAQTICAGATPALLDGQTPSGDATAFRFQWQQSADGNTWTNIAVATAEDYQPPALNATTYYRRRVESGSCSAFSGSVKITVVETPVLAAVTDLTFCANTTATGVTFTSTPNTGVGYAWTNSNAAIGLAASGTGNIPQFTAANNTKLPQTATITVTPTNIANSTSCAGSAATFKITVLPRITLQAIPDEVVCAGATITALTPVHDAEQTAGAAVRFNWTVFGTGISLTNGSGNAIPAFTASNTGNTDLVATITAVPVYQYNGAQCNGDPVSYKVTVKPSTPPAAAGPDAALCAATTYTMKGGATGNAAGAWRQLSGADATIAMPSSPTSAINGLLPGNTYAFEWTVSGFASCAATKDTVFIQVFPAVINEIDVAGKTICAGQTLSVTGQTPTGGNGSYTMQWQFSTNGNSWNDIAGQTGKELIYTPTQSGFVRRVVQSQPCASESDQVQITVQAAVGNNTISANGSICPGATPAALVGAAPTGANGVFLYQWQQSSDGATWTDIAGATSKDYQPANITATTQYRRLVSSNLCSGPQSSTSNAVTITVNPGARAVFAVTKDTACAPFNINTSIIQLQAFADRNRDYEWYANGNLIGRGNSFPGYTINESQDSVLIKLKAISLYDCKADSTERWFFTVREPKPAFTISTDGGCGPLDVQINNNTPDQGLFTFYWTFGNGQNATSAQPGTIAFQPAPSANDTTYTISLHAISACDTITVTRSVLVKSKPKVLFTPNKTVGCSPMRVVFNNTTLGKVDGYVWDFGDGTIVNTTSADTIGHTFVTGVQDTFYVTLRAANDCGADSLRYAIVVSPNKLFLDFAVNGNEQSGCQPHTVRFINNSKGASSFRWDFGDGNVLSTTRNIDTITHLYQQAGTYAVKLFATNGCSDTTTTEQIVVYPTPAAAFAANEYTVCIGDTVRLANTSGNATSYLWTFGDGATSSLVQPTHLFKQEGIYTVRLQAIRTNAPGSVCTDTVSRQITVVKSRRGWFDATDTVANCAPLTVTFTNHNTPAVTAQWNFGDGTEGSGDAVTHTFAKAGTYTVTLTSVVPGGCTYITTRQVQVLGPSGSLQYAGGVLCNDGQARLQVQASNTDSIRWAFGDGTITTTTNNVAFHTYRQGGVYLPSATLLNKAGCAIELKGLDTIKVDKIDAGFTVAQQQGCSWTSVAFTDTTRPYFGKAAAAWNFGDGTTGTGFNAVHRYSASGTYTVTLVVTGNSGCADTVSRQVAVKVPNIPTAAIQAENTGCTNTGTQFRAAVQSADSVALLDWTLSNGAKGSGAVFTYNFAQPGNYTLRLIAGTVNGCYDTTVHAITINASPTVTASNDQTVCLGTSTVLTAAGAPAISWTPLEGLSCTTCTQPIASPKTTTSYVVKGTNAIGCSAFDTVVVTVIQPLNMQVSADDSICIGQSSNLLARGATTYSWSPAAGLNNTTISNPTATPTVTTTYRVVGYDGFNCFTDTAFVTVAVGQYPTINLGADLTMSTGTLHPLVSTVTNGPIRRWEWSPGADLDCATCPQPIAHIKRDVTYLVKATTAYGCSATDTLGIKVFCESAQLFIPNAFSPDGDGVNDILMVRGKGIAAVKTFRVFNRWGEVVFERSGFAPNDPAHGWDGKVRGVIGGPEVYVYTADVICENGATYTYKGNVSILK